MGIDIFGQEDISQIQWDATKKQIQEYIRNQLTEDKIADQIELKEFVDPFTGSVNKQAKK